MDPEKSGGFTLIELLIVVAIIGILAAIAIPNFLQAQVRAKVARAKADMMTIATVSGGLTVSIAMIIHPNDGMYNTVPIQLSTPIEYLSNKQFNRSFCRATLASEIWNPDQVLHLWPGRGFRSCTRTARNRVDRSSSF